MNGHSSVFRATAVSPEQYQPAGMILVARFMDNFLHQASFSTGIGVMIGRLVILVGLAIDQIAQSRLSYL